MLRILNNLNVGFITYYLEQEKRKLIGILENKNFKIANKRSLKSFLCSELTDPLINKYL